MFVYIPKDTMNEERLDSSVSDKKVMTILGVRRSISRSPELVNSGILESCDRICIKEGEL